MTRDTALRKSIHVFEGLRRMMSQGENGLIPDKGCADSFQAIDETVQTLKEMLREFQTGEYRVPKEKTDGLKDWQHDVISSGPPVRLVFDEQDNTIRNLLHNE